MRTLAALGLALALGACGEPETVLRINVQPIELAPVAGFQADLSIGGQARTIQVTPPPDAPEFLLVDGTRFTVQVARDISGSLDLLLTARDLAGSDLASGAAHLDEIAVGALNDVDVTLSPL